MQPTDEEIEDEGGWFFRVECPSAKANGFDHWIWRDCREIFDAEDLDELYDDPEDVIVIRRVWLTLGQIKKISDEV